MSLLDTLSNAAKDTLNFLSPGVGVGNIFEEGVDVAQGGVKDASTIVSSTGSVISSIGDFFSYIAWIFHPLNILRVVEFITGANLFLVGIYLLTRRGGGSATSSPIVRRAIQASPAGRIIRVRQGARMGRYEGQREAARMEARQAETRTQREASAVEREQINRNARQTARNQ